MSDTLTDCISHWLDRVSVSPSGCWVWPAPERNGYARAKYEGRMILVHRFTYAFFRGEIPEGLVIDHLCRVRSCINPWHLEPVTHRENLLRGDGESARLHRANRCRRGHDLALAAVKKNGARDCRICKALRESNRDRRRKRCVREAVSATEGKVL